MSQALVPPVLPAAHIGRVQPYVPTYQADAASRTRPSRWPIIALLLIVLVHTAILLANFAPATSEPDDNGYFAQGSLIAQTGHTWFVPDSNAQYIGMHWLLTPDGKYISRYGPGLPAAIAVLYVTLGYKAAVLINPVLSIFALLGTYALARRLLAPGWSIAAVLLLAANPTFFHHALNCDSHMAVLTPLVWGLYFLLRWSIEGKLHQIFLAGLILGVIPTVRYPEALVALGVGFFILAQLLRPTQHSGLSTRHFLKPIAIALLGALIPLTPLLIRNQLLLGAFWRTGYALTNEQTGFSWHYFTMHFADYLHQMQGNGLGVLFGLGLLGFLLLSFTPTHRRLGIMLTLITMPWLALYMAYYWAPQMNDQATLRFIVPTFPLYIIAALFAATHIVRATPSRALATLVPVGLVILQLCWGTSQIAQQAVTLHHTRDVYTHITDALLPTVGKNDILVAQPQLLQHLDYVRAFKLADASFLRPFGGPGGPPIGMGGPNAPSPRQAAKSAALAEHYTGSTEDRMDQFTEDVIAWAGKNHIYIVGTQRDLERTLNGGIDNLKILQHIPLPAAPPMPIPEPMMGAGGQQRRRNNAGGGMGGMGGPPGMGAGGLFANPYAGEKELLLAEYIPSPPVTAPAK